MNKIAPDHLARSAFVYVRQSTADQLIIDEDGVYDPKLVNDLAPCKVGDSGDPLIQASLFHC
jgi:hypothetical protein